MNQKKKKYVFAVARIRGFSRKGSTPSFGLLTLSSAFLLPSDLTHSDTTVKKEVVKNIHDHAQDSNMLQDHTFPLP